MALGLERPGGKYWWAEVSSHIGSTLKKLQVAINGLDADFGTQALTLRKLGTLISAEQLQYGTIAGALPKPTVALQAAQTQQGSIAVSLAEAIVSIMGEEIQQGTITAQTLKLVATLAGIEHPLGVIASELQQITSSMNGLMQPEGSIATQLGTLSTLVTAIPIESGLINLTLPQPAVSLAGEQAQIGSMASALPLMSSSMGGAEIESGVINTSLFKPSSALAITEQPEGTIAATLKLAATALAAGQTQIGTISSLLPQISSTLTAGQTQGGTIAVALKQALTALVAQSVVSGVIPDATGAGGIDENSGSVYSFNSNATAGSTLFVFTNTADAFGHQPVNSVIYDPTGANVAMKLMTHVFPNNDSGKGDCYCYYLENIVGSNKQVQVTLNGASFSVANSRSYNNVQNITLLGSAYSGTATAPSVSANPALAGDIVVNAFQGQLGPSVTPSGGTLVSNIATTTGLANAALAIQETTTSTTFSGTSTASNPTWASITINLSATPSAVPLISGVNTSSVTTVSIPAHVPGNLIVIVAFNNGGNSPPGKPGASGNVPPWAFIDHLTGANSCSMTTASFVATTNSHTSGTWTGMTNGVLVAIVITGAGLTPIGGHAQSNYNVANKMTAPALTLVNTDGTSMILEIYAQVNPGSWNAAPAGYTRQAAYTNTGNTSMLCVNTKNDTTSDGAIDQPNASGFGSNQPGCGTSIEIRKH